MFLRHNKVVGFIGLFSFFLSSYALGQAYDGPKLGEPEYQAVDRNYVNLANGSISYSVQDVSIGTGNMALSHSFSINHNDALNFDSYVPGYKDKYQGGIRRILYSQSENKSDKFEVISVFDHESTTAFTINGAGEFEGLKNDLSKLDILDSSTYQLTKPDGTLVTFKTGGTIVTPIQTNHEPHAYMQEIKYPNGFTITIHKSGDNIGDPIKSVTTNNGLQLKYIYDIHNRPLEASKIGQTDITPYIIADSTEWSTTHPSKIIALNNAVEICDLLADTCIPSNTWPEANYSWPDGMPRAFYIDESVFSVEDAAGRVTEFHHKGLSRAYSDGTSSSGTIFPGLEDTTYPRIMKIKSPEGRETTYTYKNYTSVGSAPPFTWITELAHGILNTAKTGAAAATIYYVGPARTPYQAAGDKKMVSSTAGNVYKGVHKVVNTYVVLDPGKIITSPFIIETWDKNIYLTEDFAGEVDYIENKLNDTTTYYTYDSQGRLEITDFDGIKQQANFPSLPYCSPQNCNKPTSVSNKYNDFLGVPPIYTTTYYSSAHGQIDAVVSPANASNRIARTQYTYQDYYARYLNGSEVMTTSTVPIKLLSSSYSCKNSNMSGLTCTGADTVETVYEYGTGTAGNNLFLIGQTTTTQGESEVYKTCFKYDKYGHQIEQSQPKSGLTDCNIGREY